jgi:DNA/RNA-binding domain of Phe-tRNA-synthetase-like protein
MLVLTDEKQILSIYPYRDCDYTRITTETLNVMIVGYGAPGITQKQLTEAVEATLSFIKQVSGGESAAIEMSQSNSR